MPFTLLFSLILFYVTLIPIANYQRRNSHFLWRCSEYNHRNPVLRERLMNRRMECDSTLQGVEKACSNSIDGDFSCYDEYYEHHSLYLRNSSLHKYWFALNEKRLFHLSVPGNVTVRRKCTTVNDVMSFYARNKDKLLVPCTDNRVYSHCQEYYLLQIHTDADMCSSYAPTPYIHNADFTGVTLVNQLSYSRIDRLPYLLKRWKGPISSVFCIDEIELRLLAEFALRIGRQNILFNIYIRRLSPIVPYMWWNTTKKEYPEGIYPLNVLRDIGIDSIETTHYLLLDIDVFPSSNLYRSILENSNCLLDYHNALVFQLFHYKKNITRNVTKISEFHSLWDKLPYDKYELLDAIERKKMQPFVEPYQNVVVLKEWAVLRGNKAYPISMNGEREPYGVFRRSAMNSLFHPYFINYGRDKIYYYWRLNMEGKE